MKHTAESRDEGFEFKIDGDVLYAPRESMTIKELIDIAVKQKVLDRVEGGYTFEDGKGNKFALDSVVHLDKTNVFFASENEPGPAS